MKRQKSVFLCAALVLALLLSGCASKSEAADMAMPVETNYAYSKSESFMSYDSAMVEETATDTAAPSAAPTEAGGGASASAMQLPEHVKMIYRAHMELETTAFDDAVTKVDELVTACGGYYEMSELNNYSRYRSMSYTIRVPSEQFAAFYATVAEGGICQVNSISRESENISEAYYDTESRLTTQRTKLARLQELLAQAENMEDIITLESAISDTEWMIENLSGTLRHFDSLVGYSTIYMTLSEVYKLSEVEQAPIGFGERLASAFRRGCSNFVDGLQNLLLGFAYNWVGWLIFFGVAALVIALIVRLSRRRRARRAQRPRKVSLPKRVQTPSDDPAAAETAPEEKQE